MTPDSHFVGTDTAAEDGKEMKLDVERMKLKDIQNEVDRHSRVLRRADELSGN